MYMYVRIPHNWASVVSKGSSFYSDVSWYNFTWKHLNLKQLFVVYEQQSSIHVYIADALTCHKVSWVKPSASRDGTLKKPAKQDGEYTTILSQHPYILCQKEIYHLHSD